MLAPTGNNTPSRSQAAAFLLLAALGVWAYWPTLARVVASWGSDPDYTHGFLVPILSLWLLWRGSHRVPESTGFDPWALFLLGAVAAVRVTAGRVYLPELDAWSIPLWLGGITWLVYGRKMLGWVAPALVFLCFAAPLPASVEVAMGGPLRQMAAQLSGGALRSLGQPAVAEGSTVLLEDHILDVEEACSGLRMFYGITALAVACVILLRPKPWKAALLIAAAFPVAVGANVARIALTGLLHQHVSGEAAEQFGHDYAALLMIPLAVVAFLLVLSLLGRLEKAFAADAPHRLGKLLGGITAAAVALVALAWASGAMQEVAAERLLADAERQASEDDWPLAIESLRRYDVLRPNDPRVLERLAKMVSQHDRSPAGRLNALSYFDRARRNAPGSIDLAMATGQTAYEAGRFRQAAEVCAKLIRQSPPPEQLEQATRLRANALLAAASLERPGENFDNDTQRALHDAVALPTPEVRHVVALVEDHERRSTNAPEDPLVAESEALLGRLIETRPDDPSAWLARHLFHEQRRHREPASNEQEGNAPTEQDDKAPLEDLRRALDLAEGKSGVDAAEVYLVAADRRLDLSERVEAIGLYRQAIAAAPSDYRAYLALAETLWASGGVDGAEEAADVIESGVEAVDGVEIALAIRLATLRATLGQWDRAEAALLPVEAVLEKIPTPLRGEVQLAIDLVRSQILRETEGLGPAVAGLNSAVRRANASGGVTTPDVWRRANEQLGMMLAASGWHEMAVQALLSAASYGPLEPEPLRVLANSAALSGDLRLATTSYESLIERTPDDIGAVGDLLSVAVRLRAQSARADTPWSDLARRLEEAVEAGLPTTSAVLVQAEILLAQGKPEQALQGVEEVLELAPESAALWRGLMVLRQRAGDPEGAVAAARRFGELSDNPRNAVLPLAQLLIRQERYDQAVELLEGDHPPAGPAGIETTLLLAEIDLRRSDIASAVDRLERHAAANPTQIRPLQALAKLTAAEADWDRLADIERRLQSLEGESGVYWRRYAAERLLATASNLADPMFRQAVSVSDQLMRLRPSWAESHYLRGEVARRLGNEGAAAGAYLEAWRRGKRDVAVADRALEALIDQRRFIDASAFLAEIQELLVASPRLFDRAASIAGADRAGGKLVELARSWVDEQPGSPIAHLRLARALKVAAAGETDADESRRLLELSDASSTEAVRLKPADPNTWLAAISLRLRPDDTVERLPEIVGELIASAGLADPQRSFVLAQVLETLDQQRDASVLYTRCLRWVERDLAAEKIPPEAASDVIARVAEFSVKLSPYLAERRARAALALSPGSPPARLALVRALAEGRDTTDQALSELSTLEASEGAANSEPLRRLRAELLWQRGTPTDLQQAIALVESGLGGSRADRLTLADLNIAAERHSTALDLLVALTDSPVATTEEHAAFLAFWQERFLTGEDAPFTEQAERSYRFLLERPERRGVWLRWKLREAARLAPEEDTRDRTAPPTLIAQALSSSGGAKLSDFTALLRVAMEEGATDDAFLAAESPPAGVDAATATTAMLYALVDGDPIPLDGDQLSRLAGLVESAGERVEVWQSAGDYYLVAGRAQDACEAYQRAVEIAPNRVAIHNNLAVSWSLRPDGVAEANRWIDRAEELGFPLSEVVDTRAWILLVDNQPAEALGQLMSLDESTLDDDPVRRLHVAMALERLGRHEDAVEQLDEAIGLGAEAEPLLAPEVEFVDRMKSQQTKHTVQRPATVATHRGDRNATPRSLPVAAEEGAL